MCTNDNQAERSSDCTSSRVRLSEDRKFYSQKLEIGRLINKILVTYVIPQIISQGYRGCSNGITMAAAAE